MGRSRMDDIQALAGTPAGIYTEEIALEEPFIDFCARFSSMPGTVVLMSGGDLDCARHHILAARPWLSFRGRGRDMTIRAGDRVLRFEADPFDTLGMLVNTFRVDRCHLPADPPVPVASGLFGYLSYDLKDHLETLPRTAIDDLCLPDICLFAPSVVVVQEKRSRATRLYIRERTLPGRASLEEDLEAFKSIAATGTREKARFSGDAGGFRSNFDRVEYMASVKKIREYIASGHVYQVNLSQRFEMGFGGDPFHLFRDLYARNPAPFFAFIRAGDHQIVSTSPERFIQRSGNRVETRPIKGTRPRGKTAEEDRRLRRELAESPKDDAELSMIVDLLRNDLGKVCRGGSVRVARHKRLEAYQNVYHLVSVVEGELDEKFDSVDFIRATFPGGSITGCPKIRSMEIIDEIEPHRRHIYTGSIGYISFHDTMDLSIAIRTATVVNNRILFSAGGGIVFDSDPEDEYDETLHKGRTLMEVFQGTATQPLPELHAWVNGRIRPQSRVTIPVTDPGLQYGYGFFETIRVDRGKPKFLKAHIDRFNRAWQDLFFQEPPDLGWNEIITQVIRKNGLQDRVAAVKILATKGDVDAAPFRNTLIVTCRPYTHRLTGKKEPGLHLITYPEPRQTPLADYKTLNYLFYFLAGRWAAARGADEALILNPDGSASETNTGNIILVRDKTAVIPVSAHVLPGTMERPVLHWLAENGFAIEKRPVFEEDLLRADQVFITNALMGVVPALSLDGKRLSLPSDLWQEINAAVQDL